MFHSRADMPADPVDVASLPPFSNQRGCPRCGARCEIRVQFDRDCAEVRGDHFHRVCRLRRPPTARTWPRWANELIALYADPDGLLKHARVVGLDEIGA